MKNIKNKLIIGISALVLFAGSMTVMAHKALISDVPVAQKLEAPQAATVVSTPVQEGDYSCVKPLQIVNNPTKYLNQKVKFTAVFDKFSVLGLDYKPAFRDSQKYITFLIKRDDVQDHTIPLSEMKIFLLRTEAEKFIDLDSGDIIEVYGKVFSNALTDSWIDVDKLVIIKKVKKDKEKKA